MSNEASPQVIAAKRSRCTIYIDGFNWYYGIFKDMPGWKWLNIQGFFEELRKDDDVLTVNLFTALVGADVPHNEARNRQKRFLKALESFSKVRIIYGYFQLRDKSCRASCRMDYKDPEEKKTDVNMAVALMNDAIKGVTDSIVIVSGDSDFQPAVEWVVKNYPKIKVTVYVPSLTSEESERRSDFYFKLKVTCKFLPLDKIPKYQLPPKVILSAGGTVERPESWK